MKAMTKYPMTHGGDNAFCHFGSALAPNLFPAMEL